MKIINTKINSLQISANIIDAPAIYFLRIIQSNIYPIAKWHWSISGVLRSLNNVSCHLIQCFVLFQLPLICQQCRFRVSLYNLSVFLHFFFFNIDAFVYHLAFYFHNAIFNYLWQLSAFERVYHVDRLVRLKLYNRDFITLHLAVSDTTSIFCSGLDNIYDKKPINY